MKEIVTVFVVMALIVGGLYLLTMCSATGGNFNTINDRMVYTGEVISISGGTPLKVVKDTKTGCLYLYDNNTYKGGLSPWINSDGSCVKEAK